LDADTGAHAGGRGLVLDVGSSAAPPAPASENPLLASGLALARANASDEGVLSALEAALLDLDGPKLAVLSAGRTGLGTIGAGEGVFGLRRALAAAGAETQVVSLWMVDDEATRDLMIAYYRALVAGGGRAEAMREARRAMKRRPETAHPFYWASFV